MSPSFIGKLDSSYATPRRTGDGNGMQDSGLAVPALTIDEELVLQGWWLNQIKEVCAKFKFPPAVFASAAIFFKRFYLRHSLTDYSPQRTYVRLLLILFFFRVLFSFSFANDYVLIEDGGTTVLFCFSSSFLNVPKLADR